MPITYDDPATAEAPAQAKRGVVYDAPPVVTSPVPTAKRGVQYDAPPEGFDEAAHYANNPSQETLKQARDIRRAKLEAPMHPLDATAQFAKGFVKGIPSAVKGFGQSIYETAGNIKSGVFGSGEEQQRAGRQLAATVQAGALHGAIDLSTAIKRNAQNLYNRFTGRKLTDDEIDDQIRFDAGRHQVAQEIQSGHLQPGTLVSAADQTESPEDLAASGHPINPEQIERASWIADPSILALGPLADAAGPIIGKAVSAPLLKGAGRGLEALGGAAKFAAKRAEGLSWLDLLWHHNPLALGATYGAKAAAKYVLPKVGGALREAGEEAAGAAPREGQGLIEKAFKQGAKGAVTGAALATPFAAGAQSPEQAGEAFGGGFGIGAALGSGAGVKGSRDIDVAAVGGRMAREGAAINYGTPEEATHATWMKTLPQPVQDLVNTYRARFNGMTGKDGKPIQIYTSGGKDYADAIQQNKGHAATPEEAASRGFVSDDGTKVFINAEAGKGEAPWTLGHEAGGHVSEFLADTAKSHDLATLRERLKAELYKDGKPIPQFAALIRNYKRAIGDTTPIDKTNPEQFESEFIAEHAGNILKGGNIANFQLPAPLNERLTQGASKWLRDNGVLAKTGDKLNFGADEIKNITDAWRELLYRQGNESEAIRAARMRDAAKPTENPPKPGAQPVAAAPDVSAKDAEIRKGVAAALQSLGVPKAQEWAAAAKGGTESEMLADALRQREAARTPTDPLQIAKRDALEMLKAKGITPTLEHDWRMDSAIKGARQAGTPITAADLLSIAEKTPALATGATATSAMPKQRRAGSVQFSQDAFTQHPLISRILDAGGLLSKSLARYRSSASGKSLYDSNKALWDDAPTLSQPGHNDTLYNPNGLPPDEMLSHLADLGIDSVPQMWKAIEDASRQAGEIARQQKQQEKLENEASKISPASPESVPAKPGAPVATLAPPVQEAPKPEPDRSALPRREEVDAIVADAEKKAVAQEKNTRTDAAQERIYNAKVSAIMDAIDQHSGGGLHRVTDEAGNTKIIGDFDIKNPFHAALVDLAGGITEGTDANLQRLQADKGATNFIRYRSSKSQTEATPWKRIGMTQRRGEYVEDPAAERTEGTIQHKTVIPVQTVFKGGRPQVTFFTLDNLLHNAESVKQFMTSKGMKFPYPDEQTLVRDAKVYADNHQHGWTGDGRAPMQAFPDSDLPAPDLNYNSETIPEDRFQALNLLMHSEDAGKYADRIQEVAEKQKKVQDAKTEKERQRLQGVLERSTERMKKSEEAFALADQNLPKGWVDPNTGESNALRTKLKAAGFNTGDALKSPFETLDPQHILAMDKQPIPMEPGDIPTVRPTGFDVGAENLSPMGRLNPKAVSAGFLPETTQEKAQARNADREIKRIVGFMPDEKADPFYSGLTRTIFGLPQETMTVEQAKAAIDKGSKADERDLTGIYSDPLSPMAGKEPGDKVTKAALRDWQLERQAKVKDVTLGGDTKLASLEQQLEHLRADWKTWFGGMEEKHGNSLDWPLEAKKELSRKNSELQDLITQRDRTQETTQPHFDRFQLPGADPGSYREQFVTWPPETQEQRGNRTEKLGDRVRSGDVSSDAAYAHLDSTRDNPQWNDGHTAFENIQNPIVRIRRNIRTDADGKKTLFLEEMQGPSKSEQEKMPEALRKRIYEIGMKRALREAAQEGAARLAWTTGEQQAERYDLSKHIDRVTWTRDEPEEGVSGGSSTGTLKAYKDGKPVISEVTTPDKLRDYIGKDAAQKLLESNVKNKNSQEHSVRELSGLELKVGGEGLRRLYDQTLPRIANELVKKFGVKTGQQDFTVSQWDQAEDMRSKGEDPEGEDLVPLKMTVHSIEIPEALRKHQMEQGNPLFMPETGKPVRDDKIYNAPGQQIEAGETGLPTGYRLERDGALWIAYDDKGKRVAATGSRQGTIQQANDEAETFRTRHIHPDSGKRITVTRDGEGKFAPKTLLDRFTE